MNKTLLKRIASVATELDYAGFTKEAKYMDSVLLKLSQEQPEEQPKVNLEFQSDEELERWMKILKGTLTNEDLENMSDEEKTRQQLRLRKKHENEDRFYRN